MHGREAQLGLGRQNSPRAAFTRRGAAVVKNLRVEFRMDTCTNPRCSRGLLTYGCLVGWKEQPLVNISRPARV